MKKILQILSIPLSIIFICFLIYGFTLGMQVSGDNYTKELMNKYKTKETRIKYYEEKKESFNYLSNLFDDYESIESIIKNENNNICQNKEYKINLNKEYSLCSKSKIDNLNKEQIVESINNLEQIVKITKNNVINSSNKEIESSVEFYLVTSLNHNIYYNYCLSHVECNTNEDYYENEDKKIYEKNRIDDKWSTIFDDIGAK